MNKEESKAADEILQAFNAFFGSNQITKEDVESIMKNKPDAETLREVIDRSKAVEKIEIIPDNDDEQELIRYDLLGIDRDKHDGEAIARIYAKSIKEAAKQVKDWKMEQWPEYWLKTNSWYAFLGDEEERLQVK